MRWTPLFALLLFLAIGGFWLTHERRNQEQWYGAGSSLTRGPEGLSLARAYAAAQGSVSTLAAPLARVSLPTHAVLVRMRPDFSPAYQRPAPERSWLEEQEREATDGGIADAGFHDGGIADGGSVDGGIADAGAGSTREKPHGAAAKEARRPLLSEAEERWVRAGGRLVLGVSRPYGPVETAAATRAPARKVFPLWPGVVRLQPTQERALAGRGWVDGVAVFTLGEQPLVVSASLGAGELVLLAAPELLENAHLAQADHLALFVALIEGRPVFFDEYVHGAEETLTVVALLHRWGLWPALFLLTFTFLLWVWRQAVPLGAPEPFRDTRTESVDLVDALAGLYGKALRPEEALALYRQRLVLALQEKLGLDAEAAQARVPAATGPGAGDFQRQLTALNEAYRRLHERRLHR